MDTDYEPNVGRRARQIAQMLVDGYLWLLYPNAGISPLRNRLVDVLLEKPIPVMWNEPAVKEWAEGALERGARFLDNLRSPVVTGRPIG